MKNHEKMAELFKAEELQERLEFGDWEASATVENNPQTGTTYSGTVSYSPDWGDSQ